MQVTITFRGMESTESLKSYVNEKVEHLERYFDRAIESHAVLSLERYLQHADITIQAGPFVLRGRVKSEDMYKSIDDAVDKIERQLRRYKDKLRSNKHRPREETEPMTVRHDVLHVAGPEQEESEEWASGPKVVRSDELVVKPMSVDEAIMQMDLMNNDFYVFINSKSSEINVVYRRKDGHFGLIEARTALGQASDAAGRPKTNGARTN
jgi:putative sigma-54 modulation protein